MVYHWQLTMAKEIDFQLNFASKKYLNFVGMLERNFIVNKVLLEVLVTTTIPKPQRLFFCMPRVHTMNNIHTNIL